MGSELVALEAPAEAKKKVGQNNAWIEVQDETGKQGFAAAWYLSQAKDGVPQVPEAVETPAADEPDKLVVYAAENRLALRRQPSLTAVIIKRLPEDSELVVLEDEAAARKKIGVKDNWLKVQDVAGAQGYVAAWFVTLTQDEPALGVTAARAAPAQPQAGTGPAAPANGQLVVRPVDAGVALRRQPVIAATTLIKRLPLTADLLVLEPAAAAEKKIGVVNQWLKVRDIRGAEGYVAAWYVIKRPAAAP
jgi:hypothetical protein